MLSKQKIKEIEKESGVNVYKYVNYQTGGIMFSNTKDITFYNEDKTEEFIKKIRKDYTPKLYLSAYRLDFFETLGTSIIENKKYILVQRYDDMENEEYELLFDTKEDALNKIINENDVVFSISGAIYTLSRFFTDNTNENINEFIKDIEDLGLKIKVLKGETK